MARLIVKVKTTAPRPQESDNTNTVVLMVGSTPQGDKGLKGKDGKDGKDGLRGLSGSDGKSLYQIALDNGFVGTFDDYQETLRGEKGNVYFATFDIDIATGELEMVTPVEYTGASFALNGSNLEVII